MFKRLLTKGKVSMLSLLCVLSMISVGFASWSITSINDENFFGSMMADNIVNTKECVFLDDEMGRNNTGIDWFDYEQTGFLNSQGTAYDDTGHIYTYFDINLDNCSKFFKEKTSLKVKFVLKYAKDVNTKFNIFENHSNKDGVRRETEIIFSCSKSENVIPSTPYLEDKSIVIEFVFNDVLLNYEVGSNEIIDLNLDYQFYATTGAYFYKNVYKYLEEDNISFELLIEITECDKVGGVS